MNKRDSFAGSDFRDLRSGSYDAVNDDGRPQPDQVHEAITPHEAAQDGADVRAEPKPSKEKGLPEGLRRPPMAPYNGKTGRGSK